MNLFGTTYSAQQQGGIYSTYRPEHNPIASAFLGFVFFAVSIAAYPAKLFFRQNMGERAVRIVDPFIYVASFCYFGWEISMWAFFINNVLMKGLQGDLSWAAVFTSLPLFSCAFLFWLIKKSFKYFKAQYLQQPINYDERVHTFYRGESKYFQGFVGKNYRHTHITQFHIQFIIEPLMTMFLGVALFFLDVTLGLALICGGICLFIDEWEVIRRRRDMILDVLDGEMDAAFVEKGRNKFRKLKEDDVDLAIIRTGFDVHNMLIESQQKLQLDTPPLSKMVLDKDIL